MTSAEFSESIGEYMDGILRASGVLPQDIARAKELSLVPDINAMVVRMERLADDMQPLTLVLPAPDPDAVPYTFTEVGRVIMSPESFTLHDPGSLTFDEVYDAADPVPDAIIEPGE